MNQNQLIYDAVIGEAKTASSQLHTRATSVTTLRMKLLSGVAPITLSTLAISPRQVSTRRAGNAGHISRQSGEESALVEPCSRRKERQRKDDHDTSQSSMAPLANAFFFDIVSRLLFCCFRVQLSSTFFASRGNTSKLVP
jgi:hypothetical protein